METTHTSSRADSSRPYDAERVAADLLAPLWRGLDPEYKAKYAHTIWQQFEGQVRSAAYTAGLARFLQRITTRMAIRIRAEDTECVAAVVGSGEDRALLKMLREEASYLVLLVRVANEERRAARDSQGRNGAT